VGFNIFNIHITLLISLGKSPVEKITPVSVHHFLNAVDVSISAVRSKIGLSTRVLPDRYCHIVDPFLLEPEADCGNEGGCVSLILTLIVKQRISLLNVLLDLVRV